jgi:DNA polymerase III epsilon subunit family exonuclease
MSGQTSLFASSLMGEGTDTVRVSALQTPFAEAEFVVLDLETTGLNAKKSSITEITAIKYTNNRDTEMFSTLVAPKEAIPADIESFTGITNEMVVNAPPLMMVMNDLLAFMGNTPLVVGHNVSFDIGFLREKCRECGFFGLEERIAWERAFCTKMLAQKLLPGLPSYEGILVATQIGYHNPSPHRAEADVRMSAAILFALADKAKRDGHTIATPEDLLNIQGRIAPKD